MEEKEKEQTVDQAPAKEEGVAESKPAKKERKIIKSPFLRVIFSNALKQSDEQRNVQIDMLRYRNNGFATTVGYLGLVAMIVSFCFLYSTITISMSFDVTIFGLTHAGLWCGVDIFMNILMMLFTFLTISRMKVYDRNWSIVSICLGILQIVRIFLYPLALHNANTEANVVLPNWLFTMQIICYIIFGVCLISCGVVTIILSKILNDYLAEQEKKEAH